MSAEKAKEDKLRSYLGSLPSNARKTLLRDLQTAEIRGSISESNLKILRILEDMGESIEMEPVSEATIFETLFAPFSPFMFNAQTEMKLSPRLMRGSLESIYRWFKRDIFKGDLTKLETELSRALYAQADDKVKVIQKRFMQMVQKFLTTDLQQMISDREFKRKLTAQLGGEIVMQDALDMARILKNYPAIASLSRILPDRIDTYSDDVRYSLAQSLKSFTRALPGETPLFFTFVYHKMEHGEDLLRFVQDEMETDDPKRLSQSEFAFCFDIVLHDITLCVDQISANVGQVRNGHVSLDGLIRYVKLARMFRAALDTSSNNEWSRRFGEQVKRLSALLTVELSQLPQLLRQCLGYMRKDRGASKPDEIAKNQAVYLAKLLRESRRGSSTLALNALLPRIARESEQYVDVVSGRVLDEIRSPANPHRDISAERLRYLSEIAAVLMDEEYAQVLLKSGGLISDQPEKRTRQAS